MLRNINEVINAIKSKRYDVAYEYLHAAMIEKDHSPEVYNLLGIISEYKSDVSLAGKYYRVANVFDPTYKSADRNLAKLTSFYYIFNEGNIDFGDNSEKEYEKSYSVEYNEMNIGHLISTINN